MHSKHSPTLYILSKNCNA